MNQFQRKHLLERMLEVARAIRSGGSTRGFPENKPKTPPAVVRAQAVVAAWNKKMNALERRRYDASRAWEKACREQIEFGDPQKALDFVKRGEKKYIKVIRERM